MKKLSIVLLIVATLIACGGQKAGENVENPGEETLEALLVEVKTVNPEKFEHFFTANGSVEAVNDAFISPEINGQVKRIHVKEGQRVKKGQLLVSLNADVIRNSIAEVKTGLELATTIYEKRKGLWEKKIGSEVQYLQAKTDKESLENKLKTLNAQLDMAQITAPISGIVDEIFNKEGELAVPGMQLIRLVNLKKIYVNADVSEAYLSKVAKGDNVSVTFPSYPGMEMDAVVYRTGNVVKQQNRTFLVQLKLDNEDEKLKPNVLAVIRLKDFSTSNALVVPAIIVKNDLKGEYVYVAEKEGTKVLAKKTYVKPGMSYSGLTVIQEGLKPGDRVVVKGYNLVRNGLEITTK